MEVAGAVALITGGASGLGLATAIRLAASGAAVAVVDLDEDRGRAEASEIGDALFIQCDVRDPSAVTAAVPLGIRVMTIAPAAFDTSILAVLPAEAIASLEETTVFPHRLGKPEDFAQLVQSIVENRI